MIDFFDNHYNSIVEKNKYLKVLRFYSVKRYLIIIAANFFLPIYFKLTSTNPLYKICPVNIDKCKVIVSLTSFPARINRVYIAIESILRQKNKPDMIILWLSREQFNTKESLPKNLLRLEKRGLTIEIVEGDLKSHKKYFYTLKKFPESVMVTIDDDIIYPSNMISELLDLHRKYPNAVIARYATRICSKNNVILPYKTWLNYYYQNEPEYNIFFGSGGGTLFPPYSLPEVTLNEDIFTSLCFSADDVWLNAMCRINKIKVMKTRHSCCSILPILNKNKTSLSIKNIDDGLNDNQIDSIRKYFINAVGIDPFAEE